MKIAIARCFQEGYNIEFTTASGKFTFHDSGNSIHARFTSQDNQQPSGTRVTISNVKSAKKIVDSVRLHFLDLLPDVPSTYLRGTSEVDVYDWPPAIGVDLKLRNSIFVDGVMKKSHQSMPYLFNFKGGKFSGAINVEQGVKTGKWKIFRNSVERMGLTRYMPSHPPASMTPQQQNHPTTFICPEHRATVDSIVTSMAVENSPLYSMSGEQRAHLLRARGVLHERLRDLKSTNVSRIRNQGSVDKNTAIPFDADLDIVIYLNDPSQAEELRSVRDLAIFNEGSHDILTGLYRFEGVHYNVDLVIGSDERGDGPANVQDVKDAVGSNNYVFEVMRMIKYLFKRHFIPLKSFLIEKFVIETFESMKRTNAPDNPTTCKRRLFHQTLGKIHKSSTGDEKVFHFLGGILLYSQQLVSQFD
jgi:hypothetical protein